MDLAVLCLIVLVAVLVLSCVTSLNVGLAAIAAVWVIGGYIAPTYNPKLDLAAVVAGFPTKLFLDLAGTTLLFAAAQVNGSLAIVVERSVRLCGGRAWAMPPVFFALAFALAAAGPGNIAASALLAPSALAIAARLRIPPLVMIIAVAHGSIAGGASPLTPIGIVITNNYKTHGLEAAFTGTFLMNAVVNVLLALAGAACFGGFGRRRETTSDETKLSDVEALVETPLERCHVITFLAVLGLIVAALTVPNLSLGFAAFTAATVVLLSRSADERETIRAMPWNVILMVLGVSLLVSFCEKTGAVKLLSEQMKHVADSRTVVGWSAFITGLISIFSSTSSVVLPTFLPMVGDLVSQVGGGDPRAVAEAIVVGSNAVDVSPLSTIGALCVAAAAKTTDTKPLFNRMLLWGFAMAPLAAIVCQVML
jgi:Na+/H+ antiporter NhaD/arsenite permease-like protein